MDKNQFKTLPLANTQSQDDADNDSEVIATSGRYRHGHKAQNMKKQFKNREPRINLMAKLRGDEARSNTLSSDTDQDSYGDQSNAKYQKEQFHQQK